MDKDMTEWTEEMILDYWEQPQTEQLIEDAKPLDQLQFESWPNAEAVSSQFTFTRQPPTLVPLDALALPEPIKPTPVPDKDLKQYPYCSVGKLYWYSPSTMYVSTAFYIGKKKILTVAHGLTEEEKMLINRPGVFIPAMRKNDFMGMSFGRYSLDTHPESRNSHPNYIHKINSPAYDICTYTLGKGRYGKGPLRRHASIDEMNLTPIQLTIQKPKPDNSTWTVLGYPTTGEFKNRLVKVTGNYLPERSTDQYIAMHNRCIMGMSGGPWMLGNGAEAMANGCQSAIQAESCTLANGLTVDYKKADTICSYSPLFNDELLNKFY